MNIHAKLVTLMISLLCPLTRIRRISFLIRCIFIVDYGLNDVFSKIRRDDEVEPKGTVHFNSPLILASGGDFSTNIPSTSRHHEIDGSRPVNVRDWFEREAGSIFMVSYVQTVWFKLFNLNAYSL